MNTHLKLDKAPTGQNGLGKENNMAYIKIKSNFSTSSYIERNGFYPIQYATISQTIYTGSPVNTALSAVVGTGPSTGMYADYTSSWPDASASNDGYYAFIKKHYSYEQVANYQPRCGVYGYHNGSYGLRWKHCTWNLSNPGPNSINSYWTGYSNTSYDYGRLGGEHWNWIDEVHMIVNDTTWAIQIIGTGTDSTRQIATMVLSDIEYNASIDTHSFAGNQYYCPTVSFHSIIKGNPYIDNAAPTADQHRFSVYRPQYVERGGTYLNSSYSDSGLQWGYHTTNSGAIARLYPEARSRVGSMQVANGETTNQLIPIYYDPGMRSETADTRYGRLMNVYRTTEGSSLRTGDVITDGTTRYRIFANCWKAGGSNMDDVGYSATLAFPEDNVPFSAP